MESKVPVTEERISHNSTPSIHQCSPANISESNSSVSSEQQLSQFCPFIQSIFPPTISESDSSSVILDERLPQFCPSIQSLSPPTTSQTSSPANHEIIPYHPIESCFPPRCDSDLDSDSFVRYDISIINRYLRSFSIQLLFRSFRSSSMTSVYEHPSPSVDSNRSLNFESLPNGQILETPNLKEFTLADLRTATNNFNRDNLLSEGCFWKVFKGLIDEKTLAPSNKVGIGNSRMLVAINKLSLKRMQGLQEDWQSEVNFIGSLSHPNLVKLLGYCWKDEQQLLVYEFMQNGSLESHLFRTMDNLEPLSWDIRLKIARGVAQGLAFLHTSRTKVIRKIFKISSILLDKNYNAKISYFDLAKFEHLDFDLDPLYYYSHSLSGNMKTKSDVYDFGVILLEMLSGLRALDPQRPNGQQNLVDWLKPFLSNKRKLKTIMDARMEGQYSSEAAFKLALLILACITDEPSMKYVVEMLERIEAIKKT